jgi:hypothetical protein
MSEVLIFGGETANGLSRKILRMPAAGKVRVINSVPQALLGGAADASNFVMAGKSFSHVAYVKFPFAVYYDAIDHKWDSLELE